MDKKDRVVWGEHMMHMSVFTRENQMTSTPKLESLLHTPERGKEAGTRSDRAFVLPPKWKVCLDRPGTGCSRCSGGRGTVLACTASCSAGDVFPGSSLGQLANKAPTKPSTLNMQPD